MIPFAGYKMKIKFRYRYCCVSVTMRLAGYLASPHVAHGAIWVWDPWSILYMLLRWNWRRLMGP